MSHHRPWVALEALAVSERRAARVAIRGHARVAEVRERLAVVWVELDRLAELDLRVGHAAHARERRTEVVPRDLVVWLEAQPAFERVDRAAPVLGAETARREPEELDRGGGLVVRGGGGGHIWSLLKLWPLDGRKCVGRTATA